jgi:hypothetical protein
MHALVEGATSLIQLALQLTLLTVTAAQHQQQQ